MINKLLLILILTLFLLVDITYAAPANPWHEETAKEAKFCSAIEITARAEKLIVDCAFYSNSFHFTVANTFKFDKWAYYPRWIYIAFSEQLIKTPLEKDKYTAVTVIYDNLDKGRSYMLYKDLYMCTVYWISERNETVYQKCIYQFMRFGDSEFD